MKSITLFVFALFGVGAQSYTSVQQGQPDKVTVSLSPTASVVGNSGQVEFFSGLRYALPPVGQLRLKPPQPITPPKGLIDATQTAPTCAQFIGPAPTFPDVYTQLITTASNQTFFRTSLPQTEDCLLLNVIRPLGTKANAKLPVLFWLHGGGWQAGSAAQYDGTTLVSASAALQKPVIYVGINYRLAAFGFLGGKEILADGSANIGLLDQRRALEWVADYIGAFGGDPDRVIIWGESAGALSVYDQLGLYGGNNTYNGNPLFHGAIMNSGTAFPADPVDAAKPQAFYDTIVDAANCTNAKDTLDCLRSLDFDTFNSATNSVPSFLSYSSASVSFPPRPDGKIVVESGDVVAKKGTYAAVPMLVGNQEDEGTLFSSFGQTNITDTEALVDYFSQAYPGATRSQLRALIETYPEAISAGCPYNTGALGEAFPGYKRLASILGDLAFILMRRVTLDSASKSHPSTPIWSFLASYYYGTPVLGTFHGSDLLPTFFGAPQTFASQSIFYYYTNFAYDLDPNGSGKGSNKYLYWPKWNNGKQLMHLYRDNSALLADTFRWSSYEWLSQNVEVIRL